MQNTMISQILNNTLKSSLFVLLFLALVQPFGIDRMQEGRIAFILVFGGAVTFTSSSITLLKTESLADTPSPFVCAETVVAKKAKRIVAVVFIVKLV